MKNKFSKFYYIFLAILLIVTFQNCGQLKLGGEFGTFGFDPSSRQSGNGDGYAGVQFLYPPETESGSIFSVEPIGILLEGFSFELILGEARIETLVNGAGATVYVDSDYIGNLIIRATALTGEVKDLEIQVVEPLAVNANTQNQTFGAELRVSGKRIAVASPRKKIDGYTNAGKVTIYGINPETKKVYKVQMIKSPVLTSDYETKFGQSMASTKEDIFISSSTLNQIFHYRLERRPGKVNRYNFVQTLLQDGSVNLGHSIDATQRFLVASDRDFDNQKGRVIVYGRDDILSDNFTKLLEINCPDSFVNCGRSVRKKGDFLYVGARRELAGRNRGVLLRFSLQGVLLQVIESESGRYNYATETKHVGELLIVSQPNRGVNPLREFISIFKVNSATGLYELVQEIEHPFLAESKDSFGISIAGGPKHLFIGAPRSNSISQDRSGRVFMYTLNGNTQRFEFRGNLTPNFKDGSEFRGFGRSLKTNNGVLFMSCSVKEDDLDHRTGTLYHLLLPQ